MNYNRHAVYFNNTYAIRFHIRWKDAGFTIDEKHSSRFSSTQKRLYAHRSNRKKYCNISSKCCTNGFLAESNITQNRLSGQLGSYRKNSRLQKSIDDYGLIGNLHLNLFYVAKLASKNELQIFNISKKWLWVSRFYLFFAICAKFYAKSLSFFIYLYNIK